MLLATESHRSVSCCGQGQCRLWYLVISGSALLALLIVAGSLGLWAETDCRTVTPSDHHCGEVVFYSHLLLGTALLLAVVNLAVLGFLFRLSPILFDMVRINPQVVAPRIARRFRSAYWALLGSHGCLLGGLISILGGALFLVLSTHYCGLDSGSGSDSGWLGCSGHAGAIAAIVSGVVAMVLGLVIISPCLLWLLIVTCCHLSGK